MDEILIVLVVVCLALVASQSLKNNNDRLDDAVIIDGELVWKQIQLSAK